MKHTGIQDPETISSPRKRPSCQIECRPSGAGFVMYDVNRVFRSASDSATYFHSGRPFGQWIQRLVPSPMRIPPRSPELERLDAEKVGFLQPHLVRTGGPNPALGLALIAAGIGQGSGLMHRLDHPVVRRVCGGFIGEGRRVKTRGVDGRREQEPGNSPPESKPRSLRSCERSLKSESRSRITPTPDWFSRCKRPRVLARWRQLGSGGVMRPV